MKHLADEKYKQFNSKLVKTSLPIIGIPVPVIRKEAMKRIQTNSWIETLTVPPTIHEEVQLYSFIIAKAPVNVEERFKYLEGLLLYFDNWQVVDGLVSSLKEANKYPILYWDWLQTLKENENSFIKRFVIVMLFTYFYIENSNEILEYYESIQIDEYYVKMAVAWGISKLYLKDKAMITTYLETASLDDWTYNKAIQKIMELSTTTNEEKDKWKSKKRFSQNRKV